MLRTTSVLSVGGICAIAGFESELGARVAAELRTKGNWEVRRFTRVGDSTETIHGATTLVILDVADYDQSLKNKRSVVDDVRHSLSLATENGIETIIFLSSAMVYGAWANNPVPLTEDSTLRPDPGLEYTRQLATAEQLLNDWRKSSPNRKVAVLRSVPIMSARHTGALVRALAAGLGARAGADDAPAQFVHEDDLIAAIRVVMDAGADGVFNVAPDGSIPGDSLRSLSGAPPRVKLPEPVAAIIAELRWKFQRGPIPPGLRGYVHSPWVVSNGKLRALGWEPRVTNEQAFVEGTEAKWWTMLTPKRKQEIALGAMVVGSLVVLGFLARWLRRAISGR